MCVLCQESAFLPISFISGWTWLEGKRVCEQGACFGDLLGADGRPAAGSSGSDGAARGQGWCREGAGSAGSEKEGVTWWGNRSDRVPEKLTARLGRPAGSCVDLQVWASEATVTGEGGRSLRLWVAAVTRKDTTWWAHTQGFWGTGRGPASGDQKRRRDAPSS